MRVPYQTPPLANIGAGFSNLGKAFLSGPNPMQAQLYGAQMDAADANARKTNLEGDALAAKAQGLSTLGGLFAPQPGASDPHGTIFDAGTPGPATFHAPDINTLAQAAIEGGIDVSKIGDLFRAITANGGGTDDAIIHAMAGAGNAIGINDSVSQAGQAAERERQTGVDMNKLGIMQAGEDRRTGMHESAETGRNNSTIAGAKDRLVWENQNKPLDTAPGHVISTSPGDTRGTKIFGVPDMGTTQADVLGRIADGDPNVPPGAQAAVGAMDKSENPTAAPKVTDLRNYMRPDGSGGSSVLRNGQLVDVATGQPLPQGTQTGTNQSNEGLSANNATQQANAAEYAIHVADRIGALANNSNIGLAGSAQSFANGLSSQAGAILGLIGHNPQEINQALGIHTDPHDPVDMRLFNDPSLSQLQVLQNSMAYAYAGLNGQTGHSVSNVDFQNALKVVGMGWFTSPQALQAGLEEIRGLARFRYKQAVGKEYPEAAPPKPAATGTGGDPVHGQQGLVAPTPKRIRLDASGNVLGD